jgi:sigma-B regulation protein RsbU (phosphoserine phosphatase)
MRVGKSPEDQESNAREMVEPQEPCNKPDWWELSASEFLSIFSGISRQLVDEKLADCEIVDIPPHFKLLSRGEYNATLYLILSGQIRIFIGGTDSNHFLERGPGDCIGDMSIIDGKPTSASVITQTHCRLLKISKDEFWTLLAPIPGVVKNLLTIFVERMRASNQLIIQREREHMEVAHLYRDMRIARTIQADLLPSLGAIARDHPEIDIFAIIEPAREIGGDFYDAFFVAPKKLFFCIGDVSGKGLPAALFMGEKPHANARGGLIGGGSFSGKGS